MQRLTAKLFCRECAEITKHKLQENGDYECQNHKKSLKK